MNKKAQTDNIVTLRARDGGRSHHRLAIIS
jgi:hypothetical protein